MLRILRGLKGHEFWPDDLTLLDSRLVNCDRLLDSSQVTDTYLLALAAVHGGKLATFDRHLVVDAVADGSKALQLLG
jgi:predicted nucleic acid-binding protein